MAHARLLFFVMCICICLSTPAVGQNEPAQAQVDLSQLIETMAERGRSVGVQDPVWDLRAPTGQQLLLLPMVYRPTDTAYTVSRPEVSPRSGRFVSFYVPGDGDRNRNRGRGQVDDRSAEDLATLMSGDTDAIAKMLVQQPMTDEQRREMAQQRREQDREAAEREALERGLGEQSNVLEYAPRLARSIQIQPDGMVQWEVDRTIIGAEAKTASEQNPYGYVIDPAQIREKEPPRPERPERRADEDTRAFATRRREEQQAYRDKVDEYRNLREKIRDLPGQFKQPLPEVVYAVFLVNESDTLELQGPAPYPWKISRDHAQNLISLAQARAAGRDGGLSEDATQAISVSRNFLADKHPLSLRAVALAVYQSKMPGQVEANDAGFRLIDDLLSSDDPIARQITIASIAQTTPPTRASAMLLGRASPAAPDELKDALQLASLRATFAIEVKDTGNAIAFGRQITRALADEAGPSASLVLEELFAALQQSGVTGGQARRGGITTNDADQPMDVVLVREVSFAGVPEGELDAAIAQIIRRAPESRVASGWVDRQLLGSGDDRLVGRTLDLLSRAGAGSTLVKPVAAELRDLVFGGADAGEEASNQRLNLTLTGSIPLDSADHGIIQSLNSIDPAKAALAWQALRHFAIAENNTRNSAEAEKTPEMIFDLIVGSGVKQDPTPLSLINFIDGQQEGRLAEHAAIRLNQLLLTDLAPAAAKRAAGVYVASADRYARPLSQMEPNERAAVIQQLYANLSDGSAPPVVGLSLDPQGGYARWFAEELGRTRSLPTARQWATAFDQAQLTRSAATADLTVRAAASSALVIAAGGDQADQVALMTALSKLKEPNAQQVTEAWTPIKQEIYAEVLGDAAGPYRVVLTHRGEKPVGNAFGGVGGRQLQRPAATPPDDLETPAQLAPPGDPDQPIIKQIELGVIDLNVDGTRVALSLQTVPVSVPDEHLAIRLNHVSTLTSFNSPDLADLPLSQLRYSLDLLPDDRGNWIGHMRLPDGTTLQVALQPT